MNLISTYIFVHDQQIILDCDLSGKFNNLPSMKYVFLGMGQTDKIDNRHDVIIARNLQYNIEQYPKFCSYTGWYALWKNNLILSDYVHLFEYDITIRSNFNEETQALIEKKPDFIGYVPLSINFAFINPPKYLAGIVACIKKTYNINIEGLVVAFRKKNKRAEWSSTSNSTFSFETLNHYMVWFEKLIDDLKENQMSGHAHERSLTMFNLIFNKNVVLTKNLIQHQMLNSSQYT